MFVFLCDLGCLMFGCVETSLAGNIRSEHFMFVPDST